VKNELHYDEPTKFALAKDHVVLGENTRECKKTLAIGQGKNEITNLVASDILLIGGTGDDSLVE
jgi:hypothetical protein